MEIRYVGIFNLLPEFIKANTAHHPYLQSWLFNQITVKDKEADLQTHSLKALNRQYIIAADANTNIKLSIIKPIDNSMQIAFIDVAGRVQLLVIGGNALDGWEEIKEFEMLVSERRNKLKNVDQQVIWVVVEGQGRPEMDEWAMEKGHFIIEIDLKSSDLDLVIREKIKEAVIKYYHLKEQNP